MVSTFQRNRYFKKVSINKTFTNVQEQEKSMSPRYCAYIPSSVKSPLSKIRLHCQTVIDQLFTNCSVVLQLDPGNVRLTK